MKKLLLSFSVALLTASAAFAESSYKIVFATGENNSGGDLKSTTDVSTVIAEGDTCVTSITETTKASVGTGGLKLGTNKNAGYVTFQLASSAIVTPTRVVVETTASKNPTYQTFAFNGDSSNAYTADNSTTLYASFEYTTFSGEMQTMTLAKTNDDSDHQGYLFVKSVTVYYDEVESNLERPTFNPDGGTYYEPQTVTISCPTEGATLEYALNDGEYQEYTEPIEISETSTLKARATLGEEVKEASATYSIYIPVKSVAEIYEKYGTPEVGANTANFVVGFDATVTYFNGSNLFVTDGTDYILIYKYNSWEFVPGDVVKSGWMGNLSNYNYTMELVPVSASDIVKADEAGVAPEPLEITDYENEFVAANQSRPAVLKGVTFEEATPGSGAFTGKVGETEVPFYNSFKLESVEAGDYDVYGIIRLSTDGSVQMAPTEFVLASTVGVSTIAAENAAPVYYNLQGVRVANPEKGLFIQVSGNNAVKVAL
jgi:hypothetical protein